MTVILFVFLALTLAQAGSTADNGAKPGYVSYGENPGFHITGDMTITAWVRLAARQYLDYSTNWTVFSCENYNKSGFILRVAGDNGKLLFRSNQDGSHQVVTSDSSLLNHTLYHIAVTKKAGIVTMYIDGLPNGNGTVKDPAKGSGPLVISDPGQYFPGTIKDFRIYDRALSDREILSMFRGQAGETGKAGDWIMEVFPHSIGGFVSVEAVTGALKTLNRVSGGATIRAELRRVGAGDSLMSLRQALNPESGNRLIFQATDLPRGEYEVAGFIEDGPGPLTIRPRIVRFSWDGNTPRLEGGARRLNNLVVELLSAESGGDRGFTLPYDSWVHISCTGDAAIFLDSDSEPLALNSVSGVNEVMRYMTAGKHTISCKVQGGEPVKRLVVRAIPELVYCAYPANPHVSGYGEYDWEYLSKHVLPQINSVVSNQYVTENQSNVENLRAWKAGGGRVFFSTTIPSENAYEHWSTCAGMQSDLTTGTIVDEFIHPAKEGWSEAVERIYSEGSDKLFYGWALGAFPYAGPTNLKFVKSVLKHGGKFSIEYYIPDMAATEAEARTAVHARISRDVSIWERLIPGSTRSLIMNFGYMSSPPERLNVNPGADFKVLMDLEMHKVANDPTFCGMYGISWYLSPYADEETIRWGARLLRHYGIEGKKNLLSAELGFRYELDHLKNPDFVEDMSGWKINPASPGSMEVRDLDGWSWLEGRYPPIAQGDVFLWTKRSASKPNTFSQTVRNLVPGRLYSLKMFTADYQDIVNTRSIPGKHAVSISLDGAQFLPGKSIQEVMPNCYDHFALGFDTREKRAWMNYHVRVFRAAGKSATLTISDWAEDASGPEGQELMFNFLEVQPYFDE